MLVLLLVMEVLGLRQEFPSPSNVTHESVTFIAPDTNTTTTPIPYEIPKESTINVSTVTVTFTTSIPISNSSALKFPSCDQLPACAAITPPPSSDVDPNEELIAQLRKQVSGISR